MLLRGIKGPLQESTALLFEYFGISCLIINKIKTAKDTKNIYIISEGSTLKYKRERKKKTQKIKSSKEKKNVNDKSLMINKSILKHKHIKTKTQEKRRKKK